MRLEILGMSVGVPFSGACSGYLVREHDTAVLLDCGPGVFARAWERGVVGSLDAIVISHLHQDHLLDLLLWSSNVVGMALDGPTGRVRLLLPPGGRDVLARLGDLFTGDGLDRFATTFDIEDYDAASTPSIGPLQIGFAPTGHADPCFAARVRGPSASLVYTADAPASGALDALAADADLLLAEATLLDEADTHGHMTATDAAGLATRARARALVLTHLFPGAARAAETLRRGREAFSGPVALAEPGARFEV